LTNHFGMVTHMLIVLSLNFTNSIRANLVMSRIGTKQTMIYMALVKYTT